MSDQTLRLSMSDRLVVLTGQLQRRYTQPQGPLLRDADKVARYILRAQSGSNRPTVQELVTYFEQNPTSGGERTTGFNREAWTTLIEKVFAALQTDDPAAALKEVHVSTAPH